MGLMGEWLSTGHSYMQMFKYCYNLPRSKTKTEKKNKNFCFPVFGRRVSERNLVNLNHSLKTIRVFHIYILYIYNQSKSLNFSSAHSQFIVV